LGNSELRRCDFGRWESKRVGRDNGGRDDGVEKGKSDAIAWLCQARTNNAQDPFDTRSLISRSLWCATNRQKKINILAKGRNFSR
jgi:hypothetical protein